MKRLIPLGVALILTWQLFSQPSFETDYFWLNASMGNNSITGQSMNLGFFAQLKEHVFGVSFTVNNEGITNPFVNKHPDIFNHDISLLYGRRWTENFGYISIYSGMGMVIGADRGILERRVDFMVNRVYEFYREDNFVVAGLPLLAEIKVTPVPWMGLGITAVGNINTKMPYGAVMFSASFGRVIQSR